MKTKKDFRDGNVLTSGEKAQNAVINAFMIVLCTITALLFLIVVGSSFQSQNEINQVGYRLIPKEFSLEAYRSVFKKPDTILSAYIVTIVTTLLGAVLGTLMTAGYAYPLSRKDFRYRKILSLLNLISMLFNGGMVATYIVMTRWFGLKNNMWVLILPLIFSPWNIILMKSFFVSIPDSLVEAAKIDGAGEFRIFFRIVVPVSKPIIATIALFLTLTCWNDYQTSLLYITNESLYKLQYLLMKILTDMDFLNSAAAADIGINLENVEIPTKNLRMAMCVVAAGPILVVFPFFQKYFTKGITLGGVKE